MKTAQRLFEIGDKTWLRSRTIVITFEEAWPLAHILDVQPGEQSKIENLTAVAISTKQKDAASLGALAYAHHEADKSVNAFVGDSWPVRVVSKALGKPQDFFAWAYNEATTTKSRATVSNAKRYLAAATWGWDKACILAGAFLSTLGEPLTLVPAQSETENAWQFPFWVALDKHTPQGKAAIKSVCKEESLSYRQVIWAGFYEESARVNAMAQSPWWEIEKVWRLRKAGLSTDEAAGIWGRVRPLLAERLADEANGLRVEVLGLHRQGDLLKDTSKVSVPSHS